MAITIKSIPVLKAKEAKVFEKKIETNIRKKSTVNFTKQTSMATAILEKASL